MAASLTQGNGDLAEVHEINVTPVIDVILVLLIIFMVAAPLATVEIAVDLPASHAQPQPRPDKPVYLTVKPDLSLSVGNETVGRSALPGVLDASPNGQKDARIFLRADKLVPSGDVLLLKDMLRAAGYLKVALVGMEQASPL